ncbi:MAG: hypothetical protein HZB38_05275 [Planctomycetes bacterium]|nr:hypothetical protein [Planctomycetota bacterium]
MSATHSRSAGKRRCSTPYAACLALAAATPALAQIATFQALGDLPGGTYYSYALGVSADGSTVVGVSNSANGPEAFKWTALGIEGLGSVPGGSVPSAAYETNADGSVIVGCSRLNGATVACRWDDAAAAPLPSLAGWSAYSLAYCISSNASFIGGFSSTNPTGGDRTLATLWSDDAALALPDIANADDYGMASDVSDDGTLVGSVRDQSGQDQACAWSGGQLTLLPRLAGSGGFPAAAAQALAISGDGRVIAGNSPSSHGAAEACLWINGIAQGLGDLPGLPFASHAWALDRDGTIIVGDGNSNGGDAPQRTASVWDAEHGMRDLRQVLIDSGADVAGWTLHLASGVSADGTTVCGVGTNPQGNLEAFVAHVPCFRSPSVLAQPVPQSPCAGRDASFQIEVAGGESVAFQWRKAGANLVDGCTISGATTAQLTLHAVAASDAAQYDCVISNACGSVITAPAVLRVSTLVGDLDCDCQVGLTDLTLLLSNFGTTCN